MQLAEALRLRKDYLSRLQQLKERISNNCVVQEGDMPPESVEELTREYVELNTELTDLISKINITNTHIKFAFSEDENVKTLTEALAERDKLKREVEMHRLVVTNCSQRTHMYSRSEIKMVRTVNVKEVQKKVDMLSKSLRILDDKIQHENWSNVIYEEVPGRLVSFYRWLRPPKEGEKTEGIIENESS
ncbi:predicted protein [Scheffersomyces stipitis CBS 6054]|uniref:Uncharacterized protein n=1 Tax=Scheffersomyces stipitis (strain ATCC 58785 / CBS 6054 / NBRC 10063 / NRRL Y-11545) TaxID=322104 RepID=A3LP84_PICST|nr:predicted protein [Scheffersomyces stipitis CBS 6054]ABN64997.1 predicted protein [Scheffersomyces stipitis CBS 6054]